MRSSSVTLDCIAIARARSKAVGDAMEFAFGKWGVEEGEIITEEDTRRLAALITERFGTICGAPTRDSEIRLR